MAVTRVYALADGAETTLAAFAGKTVHAVAGVGHPSRFFSMLRAADVVVVEHALPDHGPVEPALRELAGSEHAVLMTEKDAVKCPNPERRDVWCVAADLEVEDGERLVDDVLASIGEVRGSATITG